MTSNIKAIFENGVLRPLEPLTGVPEHAEVDLTVTTRDEKVTESPKADALGWRACLGTISDSDAADMSRSIDDEFNKVDERDW